MLPDDSVVSQVSWYHDLRDDLFPVLDIEAFRGLGRKTAPLKVVIEMGGICMVCNPVVDAGSPFYDVLKVSPSDSRLSSATPPPKTPKAADSMWSLPLRF